jgi:hypothetical protein
VFGLGRRKAHRELVRAELGEGMGHFRQAANHAAGGVGAHVGPQVKAARGYVRPAALRAKKGWESSMVTVAPMAIAALDGARQARAVARKAKASKAQLNLTKATGRKRSARGGSRGPRLAGLLAAGAAFGAVAAFALRRRNQPRWDEYDPGQALDAVRSEAKSSAPGAAASSPTGSITDSAKQAATTSTDQGGIVFTDTTSPTNRG